MTDCCEPPVTEASNRSTWCTKNVWLQHPPYDPYLAPSDFHLFGPPEGCNPQYKVGDCWSAQWELAYM